MTTVAAALALTAPASAASAAPADVSGVSGVSGDAIALACPTTWSPNPDWYDDPTSGSVKNPTAPLRPGPYADCGTRETLQQGWPMVIYCYYKNTYDSTWYYVSTYPNYTRGWIYSGNVKTEGIVWPC
ncbi:hypothetical protein GCM10027162_04150 [Streptomyces incanus]